LAVTASAFDTPATEEDFPSHSIKTPSRGISGGTLLDYCALCEGAEGECDAHFQLKIAIEKYELR
jgi:hypothetical protein